METRAVLSSFFIVRQLFLRKLSDTLNVSDNGALRKFMLSA